MHYVIRSVHHIHVLEAGEMHCAITVCDMESITTVGSEPDIVRFLWE